MKIKYISFLLLFLWCSVTGFAQQKHFSVSPTVGLNFPVLDNGVGIHLGVNPAYKISNYFSFEGQVSIAYVDVDDSFLTGEDDTQTNVNTLIGGRLYVLSDERKFRPYINVLLGWIQNWERDFTETGVGVSSGVFVTHKRFLAGACFETPGNIILKIGYIIWTKT